MMRGMRWGVRAWLKDETRERGERERERQRRVKKPNIPQHTIISSEIRGDNGHIEKGFRILRDEGGRE